MASIFGLYTKNEGLASKWGVTGYPTVIIVNANGQKIRIDDDRREDVLRELTRFEMPEEERPLRRVEKPIAAAEKLKGQDRFLAFRGIADALKMAGLQVPPLPRE